MDENVKRNLEMALAWIGPIFVIGYLFFWCILGKNLPPPNMLGMSGEQLVAEFYGPYKTQIAIGNIGAATIGMLYLPWSCLLGSMLRDENGSLSVWGLLEITGGALTAWVISMAPAMWAAIAIFSTSIDPELIKFAHVATWVVFDTTYMVTTVQLFGLGIYILFNKKQQVFPRWVAWVAFIVGYMFIALVLIPFIGKGPFAVGGLFNFWVQLAAWLGGMSCFTYFMMKHIRTGKQTAGRLVTSPAY